MSSIEPLMLDKTGRELVDAIKLLAVTQGAAPEFTSWRQIQTAVANGFGPKYLPVGRSIPYFV